MKQSKSHKKLTLDSLKVESYITRLPRQECHEVRGAGAGITLPSTYNRWHFQTPRRTELSGWRS